MTEILRFPGLGIEIPLNRVAFSIGKINVYWYGILIALGVALAISYALKKARKSGIHPDRFIDVIMGGFVGGILGARIYYVVFEWSYYKDHLNEIYQIWNGGLGIYGGLIGAVVVGYFMCKWRKVKFLPMMDLAVMGFLIGQSIGRWGNFVNVEAFGCNTNLPWGMTSNKIMMYLVENADKLAQQGMQVVTNDPVHPTFLYESLWCLIGFILLHLYFKHRRFDGEVFLLYSAWYGFGRFFIEGLRTDSLVIGSVRVSQVLAAVFMFASIIIEIVVRYKIATEHDENYLKVYGTTEEAALALAALDEQLKSKPKKSKDVAAEQPAGEETVTEESEEEVNPAEKKAKEDETAEDAAVIAVVQAEQTEEVLGEDSPAQESED
ncbi:prolipoprotein diacylglyceryl transferase [Acetanaerobacterium elongatum]|uniref:Phosphatidylglycerol--prolipoprotein diacylglyceryl transferase n=1 Tax=Acetanaerobacterium elongatum TaxID=258515 RepID=A0A1H0B456_9FIRM|nr:prolipoprotein diacylglyceryl transferase [Acetanaerobacterium elongatum]SDN40416.1 phosphatidylglycerol:prolipoprotein diacylglycerol transferase [Acetanaerobacterium elongatum]